jgi:hypothetical protein
LKDKRAFEVVTDIQEIEEPAMNESYRRVNALPPQLRDPLRPDHIHDTIQNSRQNLTIGVEGHTQRQNNWFFYVPCFIFLYAFIEILRRVEATFKLLKRLKEAWDGVRRCWKKCQKVMNGSKESDEGDQQSFPTPEDDG